MSHIPASAMPHAAPHHHDAEGSARDEVTPAPDATPATSAPASQPVGAPAAKRGGWAIAALAGVALAAGAAAVAAPMLRGKARTKRKREGAKA